jgi:hypothetical protein
LRAGQRGPVQSATIHCRALQNFFLKKFSDRPVLF